MQKIGKFILENNVVLENSKNHCQIMQQLLNGLGGNKINFF